MEVPHYINLGIQLSPRIYKEAVYEVVLAFERSQEIVVMGNLRNF